MCLKLAWTQLWQIELIKHSLEIHTLVYISFHNSHCMSGCMKVLYSQWLLTGKKIKYQSLLSKVTAAFVI